MIKGSKGLITILLVAVLFISGQVVADDITDWLPDGNLFQLPDPMTEIDWSATNKDLTIDVTIFENGEYHIETYPCTYEVDLFGRLAFTARPTFGSNSLVYSISGLIDILPNGDFYTEIDINWTNREITARAGWSYSFVTYQIGDCDCSNHQDLQCTTVKCHAQSKCNPTSDGICVWTLFDLL